MFWVNKCVKIFEDFFVKKEVKSNKESSKLTQMNK